MPNKKTKTPKLKEYLQEKGVTQAKLRALTQLATGTVNAIVNHGKISKSNMILLSLVLNLNADEMKELMKKK
jgi:hypothetical protein